MRGRAGPRHGKLGSLTGRRFTRGQSHAALRYHGVPQRYGASAVVVAATELTTIQGGGEDLFVDSNPLPEGGRVSTGLLRIPPIEAIGLHE